MIVLTFDLGVAIQGDTGNPALLFGLVNDWRTNTFFDPSISTWIQTGAPFGSAQTLHSVASGALPPGVEICQAPPGGPNGFSVNTFGLQGVPLLAGVYTGTFAASGAFGGDSFSLTVQLSSGCPLISLSPASPLDDVFETEPISLQFAATGGVAPYTWDVAEFSELPDGLTISSGGLLTGAPTTAGSYTFTIRALDDNGCAGVKSYALEVLVADAIIVNPSTLPGGQRRELYAELITAENGIGAPYTFAITDGALPAGLTLAPGGMLAGFPAFAGRFTFTVTATDGGANTGEREYVLDVAGLRIVIDGEDRTLEISAADVDLTLNRQATAHLEICSEDIPARGLEVIIYARDGVTPYFGGLILTRHVHGMTPSNPANGAGLDLVDFSVFFDDAQVTLAHTTPVDLEDVIAEIVALTLGDYGITYTPTATGIVVDPFAWVDVIVSDAFKRLNDQTGVVVRVLPLKALIVFRPLDDPAPVTITDANVNAFDLTWDDPPNLTPNTVDLLCGPSGTGIATQHWTVDGDTEWEVDIQAVIGNAQPAIASHGFLGTTANFAAGETVTLGASTYTFRASLVGDVAGEVLIGGNAETSLANLIAAITNAGGSGYAPSTPVNASATAYLRNPDQLAANAIAPGVAGNSIAVSTTAVNALWYGEGAIPISALQLGSDATGASGWTQGYILEDGAVLRSLGVAGDPDAFYFWDVNDGRGTISIGNGTVAPDGTVLEFKYLAVYPFHARFPAAATPPRTFREAHPEITIYADGIALATQILARVGADHRNVEVSTDVDGFLPGQALEIDTTYRGGIVATCLVASVRATIINDGIWEYRIPVQESEEYQGSFVEQWKALTSSGGSGSTAAPGELVSGGAIGAGDIYKNGSVAFEADQSMGGHKLRNVEDPASAQDAATKAYVDGVTPTGVILADGSIDFTGDQSMGGFTLSDVEDPANPQDAATKAYVDALIGGGGGMTQLAQVVTSGSQASVDFSSIPGTYSAIRVEFFSRDTQGGTSAVVARVRINNDSTAGNYTSSVFTGGQNGAAANGTVAASGNGVFICGNPQDGNTAGIVAATELVLIGYADATFHKRLIARCAYEDGGAGLSHLSFNARWKSASAINRLTFFTDGTAFKDGSVFTLYGIQ